MREERHLSDVLTPRFFHQGRRKSFAVLTARNFKRYRCAQFAATKKCPDWQVLAPIGL